MARIYLSPPHVGPRERELLLDAFDSNWIAPLGPHVNAFEEEFAAYVGNAPRLRVVLGDRGFAPRHAVSRHRSRGRGDHRDDDIRGHRERHRLLRGAAGVPR